MSTDERYTEIHKEECELLTILNCGALGILTIIEGDEDHCDRYAGISIDPSKALKIAAGLMAWADKIERKEEPAKATGKPYHSPFMDKDSIYIAEGDVIEILRTAVRGVVTFDPIKDSQLDAWRIEIPNEEINPRLSDIVSRGDVLIVKGEKQ